MTPNPRRCWRALVVLAAGALGVVAAASTVTSTAVAATTTTATTASATKATKATKATTSTTRPAPAPSSSSAAAAPAPAPAPVDERADWTLTINRLAALLADKDLPSLQKMLTPSPVIRPFASDALQTHERLLGATTGSTLLGAHAYDKTPSTLASDLANDFTAAGEVVPQAIREGMIPPDEAAAKRANETAADWLVQVLHPEKHEVMGVIILWPPTRGRSLASEPRRATFVLVKGEKVDGQYVLHQITFGDPLESPQ